MPKPATLLVVDDDKDVLTAARLLLQQHFANVITTENPADIPAIVERQQVDVFLLDMNFAIGRNTGAEGLHWLQTILQLDPAAVVVLMTAFGDVNVAVRAMREGASDFVLKPWQNDKLVATLNVASDLRQTRARVDALTEAAPGATMIAGSDAMKSVLRVVDRVAATDATVLIRGENGTGKELIAAALHRQSKRAEEALVAVDLGAISSHLFESELFGHRQGAFTDASRDRAGRFQAASGGTLFLDEIGNLPLPSQTKLLRAIESRDVTPVGGDRSIAVDVRLLTATNQPLEDMVSTGEFREDLLYRINTIEVHLPPLRDRLDDLPDLVKHFISVASKKYRLEPKDVDASALTAMRAHRWPGNVRELSHAVQRAVLLSEKPVLTATDFQMSTHSSVNTTASLNLHENERSLVVAALE